MCLEVEALLGTDEEEPRRLLMRLQTLLLPWHEHRNTTFCRGAFDTRFPPKHPQRLIAHLSHLLQQRSDTAPHLVLAHIACLVDPFLEDLNASLATRRKKVAKKRAEVEPITTSAIESPSADTDTPTDQTRPEEDGREDPEEGEDHGFVTAQSKSSKKRDLRKLEEEVDGYRNELRLISLHWRSVFHAPHSHSDSEVRESLVQGLAQLEKRVGESEPEASENSEDSERWDWTESLRLDTAVDRLPQLLLADLKRLEGDLSEKRYPALQLHSAFLHALRRRLPALRHYIQQLPGLPSHVSPSTDTHSTFATTATDTDTTTHNVTHSPRYRMTHLLDEFGKEDMTYAGLSSDLSFIASRLRQQRLCLDFVSPPTTPFCSPPLTLATLTPPLPPSPPPPPIIPNASFAFRPRFQLHTSPSSFQVPRLNAFRPSRFQSFKLV